ncbi:MAG: ferrochelatase [Nitrospirota bacterium]
MDHKADETTGVLLLNLGGPDSLSAVRPFLFNLFSDRRIIRLGPSFMQKPLAYLISSLRAKKTMDAYRLIGGKSPISDITTAQAKALEEALNSSKLLRVYVAMRYWHPLIEEIIPEIFKNGIKRLIVLSLYPQYSVATTGSSISKLNEVISKYPIEIHVINSWYDNTLYIDALVDKIRKGIELFGQQTTPPHPPLGKGGLRGGEVHVLFSAHSLPVKFIEEGDPYVDHIRETINGITKKIDIKWSLSYQSKSGPVQWLEPSTEKMLEELAHKDIKNILVVPISFVSDHIETLYEIDILYRNMAGKLGTKLNRIESLNTSPLFIKALKDIVVKGIKEAGWEG